MIVGRCLQHSLPLLAGSSIPTFFQCQPVRQEVQLACLEQPPSPTPQALGNLLFHGLHEGQETLYLQHIHLDILLTVKACSSP